MATKKSRKSPRAQVSLLARYRSPTAFEYVNEECFDLSAGGMFIKSPAPAPTGTLLKLECAVNGGAEMLRGVARVVWLRENESDGQPSGMGVKFVKLEQGSREIIHRILVERGSIEPGELEALRPSVTPAAALEARAGAGTAGGGVAAVARRSSSFNGAAPALRGGAASEPPDMRATIPDGGLLHEPREIEDVTDEVTSAESDPPASTSKTASVAPPLRTGINGSAAREPAKSAAAKPAAAKPAKPAASTATTRPTPTNRPAQPSASGGQRTGIVVVLMLGAAAAAAAIVLSRPAAVPEPSPVVTVAVPAPEPSAVEPVVPSPAVEPAPQASESAAAAPVAVEPAPAAPAQRERERDADRRPTTERAATAATARPEPEPEPEPAPAAQPTAVAPSPEPVLVATGSSPAPVAPTAEAAPTYVLSVVTTPEGAQVTAAGQTAVSPCSFELGALDAKIEVQATMEGHAPATAVIDRIGFMLDDGRMRRRISLSLPELPKPLPDPEPVARSSRQRTREPLAAQVPKPGAKPTEKAPSATPMQAAMTCLTTGDNACAIKALEGKTRSAQELELLIETYRTLGNSAKAERWMKTYVDKYPSERRANTYRRQLERRLAEGH